MTGSDPRSPELVRAEEAALWCVRLCDGEMTSAARAELTRWLTSDPEHRAALDQAVAVWEDVNAVQASSEMLGLRAKALESLRRAQRARAGRRLLALSTPWMLAAALAIALLIGARLWWHPSPQQFSSAIGQYRNVLLADGSSVYLDASSQVLVQYSAALRTLHLLRGRAMFRVAHEPGRPFQVYAADREIGATGTTFSVEIVQHEVQVILYQGHVSVVGPGHVRTGLAAGEELIAPISRSQVRIEPVDAARSLRWESGQLELVDEPLAAAVERVNRYTRHPVSIGDAAAARVRVSGVFTAGDTRAFIEGITAVSALRVEERDGREILFASARAQR